jgi:hypothetical protein
VSLLKHLATNFTRELCHLFDTLEEMCLQLRTQRKSCSPRPVAAPIKRKLDVSANTRISEELVEAERSQKVDVVPSH